MKVAELIELLKHMQPEDKVVVWYQPLGMYLNAEGVKAENGWVEVVSLDRTKMS